MKLAPKSISSMEMPENDSRFVTALMAFSGEARWATEHKPPITNRASAHQTARRRTVREPPSSWESPAKASMAPPAPASSENRTRGH